MTSKTFHFQSYQPAIRYHLSTQLKSRGWDIASGPEWATLSDKHLTLDDSVSILMEYKHLLAWMARCFFPKLMPESYVVNDGNHPYILQALRRHPAANQPWILKPSLLNNGEHILLFNSVDEVIRHYSRADRLLGEHVLQRYVQPPALWQGRKFTLRIPAVLTDYTGVYVYEEGYLNISREVYHHDNTGHRKAHLTNYMLEGELAGIEQQLMSVLPKFKAIYARILKIIRTVVMSVVALFPDYLKPTETQSFEIFGFDFILDARGKVWLLEVNQGPDFPMNVDHPLNESLWEPFWSDVVESFVLPRVGQSSGPTQSFKQIITAAKAGKCPLLLKRKSQQFLQNYGKHIVIQQV